MRMKVLLAALLMLCSSSLVMAADYYVDITNRTGYHLLHVRKPGGFEKLGGRRAG